MKSMTHANSGKPGHGRSQRGRIAALIVTMAIWAGAAVPLGAEIFDDFESAARTATRWNSFVWFGQGGYLLSNGQARVFVTPDVPGSGAFSFLESRQTWTLQEGKTLEFRADLLGSNGDGALALFGFVADPEGYNLVVDQDTLALWKHANPLSCFYFTNGTPVKTANVKLVLSMTGMNSNVMLKFKILDNDNAGAVLFQGEYLDTAAADPMQRGTDYPSQSLFGRPGTFQVSLFRDNGHFDSNLTLPSGAKAEVVYDNAEVIEYHPPHLKIAPATNGVALNWLLPTEEHIVVEANQVAGPWALCTQPCTRIGDAFCLQMPCLLPRKFFKLSPGRLFTDDFSSLVPTWTTWFQNAGEEWGVADGTLQVSGSDQSAGPGFLLCPLGATNVGAILRDVSASVDVLDWEVSDTNPWSAFYITGRSAIHSPSSGTTYGGGLILNSSGVGSLRPVIGVDNAETQGPAFSMHQIPPPYRLQFSVLGTTLSLRVLNLTTGELIREMSLTSSLYATGVVGLWFNWRVQAGDFARVTADNFSLSGTKP